MNSKREVERIQGNEQLGIIDIITIAKSYWNRLLGNWYIILAFSIIGGVIGYALFAGLDKQYIAESKFLISQGEGGGGSGVVSVLSGFGLGGLSGGGAKSPETILAISQSDIIYNESLLKELNDTVLLYKFAKLYSDELNFDELDNYNPSLFLLPSTKWTTSNHKAFHSVKDILRGKDGQGGLVKTNLQEGTGIMEIRVSTKSESLSKALNEGILNSTIDYYVNYSTEPQRLALNEIIKRTDSLEYLISSIITKRARLTDRQQGLQMRIDQVKIAKTEIDLRVASDAYAVAIQSKETASFSLNSRMPAFQILSSPSLPLKIEKPSIVKYVAGGGVLLSILIILLLIALIFVKTAIAREMIQ